MIPKTIHYCWFGGNPFSPLIEKCIASWKKYCPGYKIIEWNENNFDINACAYVKEAHEVKKWAFVSDYARLWALVNHGGVYLDTDCELLKPIDGFLHLESFSGFEDGIRIQTAIMGCRKGHPFFNALLERYNDRRFVLPDGYFDLKTNVADITEACIAQGFVPNNKKQTVCGLTLYPKDWFCPKDYETGRIKKTKNTHCIHHFGASWVAEAELKMHRSRQIFLKILGVKLGNYLFWKVQTLKKLGLAGVFKKVKEKYNART